MTGVNMPGMDKMMKAMASVNGLAYLTEMTMKIEGTGQMAEMMRQMGAMKITTKTNSISADADRRRPVQGPRRLHHRQVGSER